MKRAVIMTRVSSDEQAKGFSLGVQLEQLTHYCQRNTIKVLRHFKEDHSAKDFNRPEFQKFLDYAKSNPGGIDYLLVTSWDRFSRNVTDSFVMIRKLKAMGIEVQAIEQPIDFSIPESKAMLAINLVFPEIDNDRRSIKIRGGIRGALKAGRWCRKAPVGYLNKRDNNNRPIIVPGPKAKHIRFAFDLISKGMSQTITRQKLLQRGVKVSKSNLSKILRNPVYIGKIVVPEQGDEQERWVEGVHDALVSESLYYRVQDIIRKRHLSKNKPLYNTHRQELPLRGKLYCMNCQSRMTGSPSRSQNGKRYFYYHCNTCKKERYSAIKVNKVFESILEDLKFTKSSKQLYKMILESLLADHKDHSKTSRETLENKLIKIDERLERLQDLFVDDMISSDHYGKTLNRYTNERETISSKLELLKTDTSQNKLLIKNAFHHLEQLSKTYSNSDVEGKIKLISSIFPENIEFDGEKCRTRRINDVLRYILQIDKQLINKKKGQISDKLYLSHEVESGRLELPSKQAIQQPSTRLVFSWVVGTRLAENHLPCPYPQLSFTTASRPCASYIYFTGASVANAVNQGFCETS